MSYFDTPATYKTEGSIIYPSSHQEYKQRQKSDYGHFDSMEYSSDPSKAQYKPNPYFSSWGSASNNVTQFNPSIVNDGMVMYYSKNNYRTKDSVNLTSMATDSKYAPSSQPTLGTKLDNVAKAFGISDSRSQYNSIYYSDSGRRVEMIPETLNKQPTANRSRISAFPHLDANYFATAPDFTDTDTKHSQQTMSEYFNYHNQFQTQDFTTPGTKTIKLESGRVITFEIKPEMKDIARCPRPQENNLEITPTKYAYNVDQYSVDKMSKSVDSSNTVKAMELGSENYPLAGLSGATIPDGMYNTVQKQLSQKLRGYDKEQSISDPKLLVPTNPIETKRENVPISMANYMANYARPVSESSKINERFTKQPELLGGEADLGSKNIKHFEKESELNEQLQKSQTIPNVFKMPTSSQQMKQAQQSQMKQSQQTQQLQMKQLQQTQQSKSIQQQLQSKEQFGFNKPDMADELYKQMLRTHAKSICDFLLNFKPYKPWMKHWKILEANLKKTNLNISKLPTTDKEIAYTLDKGEVIKFRWEDSSRYIPIDVYMYVLLHELTHESFPPSFQGHGDPFPQMLCLLCVAATELKILDIQNIPKNIYMSNGRPITSRESIKTEILFGIDMLIEANKNNEEIIEYYNAKREFVNKYS